MTAIDYNNDIPDSPNNPSDDQPLMKENTNAISQYVAVDHVAFGTNGSGHHQQVHLYNQTAPGLSWADGVLYANTFSSGIFGNQSYPVWQNALGSFLLVNYPTSNTANGYTSIPGGIMIQWGIVVGSSANTIPVAFPVEFKKAGVSTNAYFVTVIPERAATSPGSDFATVLVTGSVTSTGFTIGNIGSHTMVNWYWAAIGPQT